MQQLDALGILLEVCNGVLITLCTPINVQLEANILRVGVLNQILPHQLVLVREFLVLARVVVITEHKTILLLCNLTYLVEVVAHLLNALYRVVGAVTWDNEILATASLLDSEQISPALHYLGLLCRVLLNA